jgi:hypothetical protein
MGWLIRLPHYFLGGYMSDKVTFICRKHNYGIVVNPGEQYVQNGKAFTTASKTINISPEDPYTTDKPEEIERIRNSMSYGVDVFEETNANAVEEIQKVERKKVGIVDKNMGEPTVPEEVVDVEGTEGEVVMSYREFQKDYYANHEGVSFKEFSGAWKDYKEVNGIK